MTKASRVVGTVLLSSVALLGHAVETGAQKASGKVSKFPSEFVSKASQNLNGLAADTVDMRKFSGTVLYNRLVYPESVGKAFKVPFKLKTLGPVGEKDLIERFRIKAPWNNLNKSDKALKIPFKTEG